MTNDENDHALEFLLGFDGRIHHLEQGYWLKFEIRRVGRTPERPHGLRYWFTLHAPDGRRLIGYDNTHDAGPATRYRVRCQSHDHWHRNGSDPGTPYAFTSVDRLLADFERDVRRVLTYRGVSGDVVDDEGDDA
jgi:hypothetical protein